MRSSVSKMRTSARNPEGREGPLLLLLLVLALCCIESLCGPGGSPAGRRGSVIVQLRGEIGRPGVYFFENPPSLKDLLKAAGIGEIPISSPESQKIRLLSSGTRIFLRAEAGGVIFEQEKMSAFHRVTLGIPLSLNRESAYGLAAVPGIGPALARAIVIERKKKGGFADPEELREVPGIDRRLLKKIKPYLGR